MPNGAGAGSIVNSAQVYDGVSSDNQTVGSGTHRREDFHLDDVVIATHTLIGSSEALNAPSEPNTQDRVCQFWICMQGEFTATHRDQPFELAVGQCVFGAADLQLRPQSARCTVLSVTLPFRRLAPLLSATQTQNGDVIFAEESSTKLLSDFLTTLCQTAERLGPTQSPQASEALVQLVALTMNGAIAEDASPPESKDHALLVRAQRAIKDNLGDETLGPAMLASMLGVSRASLYRAFAPCGGIADYIRDARLRKAYGALTATNAHQKRVSLVAYELGFKDPAHFSRLFKSRFGVAPKQAQTGGCALALA